MLYGVGWIPTAAIIRLSQPSLAGVGAGAELGKIETIVIKAGGGLSRIKIYQCCDKKSEQLEVK